MNKILMWGLCFLNLAIYFTGLIFVHDFNIMLVFLGLQCVCILAQFVVIMVDKISWKKKEKRLDALLLLKIMQLRNSLEDEEKVEK